MGKNIIMKKYICSNNGWIETTPEKMRRVSRWITVKHNYNPRKNNALWEYVSDENGYKPYQEKYFNPENGLYLDYFTYQGRNYAIEQFLALGNPFYTAFSLAYENENGQLCYLSGVDAEDLYNPIYIEFDECCERVRVYEYI